MMKSTIQRLIPVALIASLSVLPACDLVDDEQSIEEQELEYTATVVADALAEQSEGLFADLYDATADISPQGMTYRQRVDPPSMRPHRGGMNGFGAAYDSETGFHVVEYERAITTPVFTKTMSARLNFRYLDADGEWLEFPEIDRNLINTIEYEGARSGETVMSAAGRTARQQQFERSATWTLSDLLSDVISLEGEQERTGHHRLSTAGGAQMERNFSLRIWTDDAVTIDRETAADGLESAVTGTLFYEMHMERTVNGRVKAKQVEGTIDLTGDGTALLRFQDLRKAFLISLDTAQISD